MVGGGGLSGLGFYKWPLRQRENKACKHCNVLVAARRYKDRYRRNMIFCISIAMRLRSNLTASPDRRERQKKKEPCKAAPLFGRSRVFQALNPSIKRYAQTKRLLARRSLGAL